MIKIKQKITQEKLADKIGAKNLLRVLNNVFCVKCGNTEMVEYENDIVIEQNGDTLLHGKCKRCGHRVARLLETGKKT